MLQRQRYDLDYPQSRVRFIDHDAGTVTTLGHVVWPPSGRDYWADREASRRIATMGDTVRNYIAVADHGLYGVDRYHACHRTVSEAKVWLDFIVQTKAMPSTNHITLRIVDPDGTDRAIVTINNPIAYVQPGRRLSWHHAVVSKTDGPCFAPNGVMKVWSSHERAADEAATLNQLFACHDYSMVDTNTLPAEPSYWAVR
jgi:hypothetical protein